MSRLLSKERVRDLLLGLALLCATLALMLYPQPSMEAAKSGLALCYNVIFPPCSPSSCSPPWWWNWGWRDTWDVCWRD